MDASGSQSGDGNASEDDAAWRDLIARYNRAVELDTAAPPWPDNESLGSRQLGPAAGDQAQQDQAARGTGASRSEAGADGPEAGSGGPEAGPTGPADGPRSGKDGPELGSGADPTRVIRQAIAPAPRWPAETDNQDEAETDNQDEAEADNQDETEADDLDEDEHFIPPPPPPLPRLDPLAKGAWTALFGGPAYLLVASIAGWIVPGWAALGAVAAFIGGFTVVVLRLGDGPSRDGGPDNGAVL